MFDIDKQETTNTTTKLAEIGYWQAQASVYFEAEKYSKAVALCNENLSGKSSLLSGRIIYAKALFHAGQIQSAEQELQLILSKDPEHLAALKYLADIKFQLGDQFGAVILYEQILTLDPNCTTLYSKIDKLKELTSTTTITLKRQKESKQESSKKELRNVLLYTETVGDLYLQQGFPRLAEEVFTHLYDKNNNPRLADKLSLARETIIEKEQHHVKKTD